MKRFWVMSLLVLCLAGCDQEIQATLYTRDIQDLVEGPSKAPLDVDITVTVREVGINQYCEKQDGQKFVDALRKYFRSAQMVSCQRNADSFKDEMVIKATTVLAHIDPNDLRDPTNLFQFETFARAEEKQYWLVLRFNKESYESLKSDLQNINMMAQINFDNVMISLSVVNDERQIRNIYVRSGVIADGSPWEFDEVVPLDPRKEVKLTLGDVKLAFLRQRSWASVFAIQQQ